MIWERLFAPVVELIPDVVGIYVHGSAASGGFVAASDLDVLVIVEDGIEVDWAPIGARLLERVAGERAVELSVVGRAAALLPEPPWLFLLHVNSGEDAVVLAGSDPDLVAHYAAVRTSAVVLVGQSPSLSVGSIDRQDLLAYLARELAWGCAEADQRYAVLNACRAVAYAQEGAFLSKIAGGQWWLKYRGINRLVVEAIEAQGAGEDLGPCGPRAREFVRAAIAELEAHQSADTE